MLIFLTISIFLLWTFLTADCSLTRTVLLVSLQAFGTMLTIYMPAAPGCAWEKDKAKPFSLGGGRQSAEEGGDGCFCEDLADGRGVALNVVAARKLLVKE